MAAVFLCFPSSQARCHPIFGSLDIPPPAHCSFAPSSLPWPTTDAGGSVGSRSEAMLGTMMTCSLVSSCAASPASYTESVPVGFYTQVSGLGDSPDDTVFTSEQGVYCEVSARLLPAASPRTHPPPVRFFVLSPSETCRLHPGAPVWPPPHSGLNIRAPGGAGGGLQLRRRCPGHVLAQRRGAHTDRHSVTLLVPACPVFSHRYLRQPLL